MQGIIYILLPQGEKKLNKLKIKSETIFAELLIVISVLIIAIRSTSIICSDTLWHIKIGDWIINHGIPHTTPYTIHKDLPFMAHEWLFDVGISIFNSIGGYRGLVLISIVICIIGFSIMVFKGNNNVLPKALMVLLISFLGFTKDIYAIPDIIGVIIIISSNFLFLSRIEEKKKYIINAILVVLLVNVHGGSFSAYIAQIILYLFVDIIYLIILKQKVNIKYYSVLISSTFLVGCINPYGISLYGYAFKMLTSNISQYMADWQPYKFLGIGQIFIYIFCIIFIFAGNKELSKFNKEDVIKYGIIFLWTAMTFKYQRCINLLTYSLIAFGGDWVSFALIALTKKCKKYMKCLIPLNVVIVTLLFGIMLEKNNYNKVSEYTDRTIPRDVIEYLKNDKVVFNYTNLGGYLIYNDINTFIDGRTDPYMIQFNKKNDIVTEHLKACYYSDYMENLVRKYNINILIFNNNTTQSEMYDHNSNYRKVYSDKKIVLYEVMKEKEN